MACKKGQANTEIVVKGRTAVANAICLQQEQIFGERERVEVECGQGILHFYCTWSDSFQGGVGFLQKGVRKEMHHRATMSDCRPIFAKKFGRKAN